MDDIRDPVQPNDESSVDIDWQIDSTLVIDDPSAGFTFGSEVERARERSYARQLARRWRSERSSWSVSRAWTEPGADRNRLSCRGSAGRRASVCGQ